MLERTRILLVLGVVLLQVVAGQQGRVLLRDVQALTLRRGEHTTGRRSSPVPQLQCVGGTAQGRFSPKAVQCYNRGFDGVDVQWECKAELPSDFQFGKISVSCEGYDYPNDPYILAGSCGLKYELDYSSQGSRKYASHPPPSAPYEEKGPDYTRIFYFVLIAVAVYLLYTWMTNTGNRPDGGAFRGGSGFDHGPGGPPGGGGPSPYGWNPPPSYDDTFGKGTSRGGASAPGAGQAAGGGPGFWSGVGLGALGGYLWGNSGNDGYAYRRRHAPTAPYGSQWERDTGFYDTAGPSTSSWHDSGGSGSSSRTHESSGFGGTERR